MASSISSVSICNTALTCLGSQPIHSLDDEGASATLCNTLFAQARTYCLTRHPWNFAIRRLELPPDVDKPLFGFTAQFTLPADCLRVLTIAGDPGYRIEGRKVLSNSSSCLIKYIADIEDVSTWSQGFTDFLTAKLRAQLAYPITKDQGQVQLAEQLALASFVIAKGIDASEDFADDFGQFDNSFVTVRF